MANQESEYLTSLNFFKTTLNELGNYVVLEDIKNVLNRLNSEDIQNGFYIHFLEVNASNEVKRNLELLSDSSKKFINSCVKNKNDCSQMILNDLNDIRIKELETIEKWKELSLLFGVSSVRKLDSKIINSIILDIKNEDTEALRDKFTTFLDTEDIDAELESLDTDIMTLASDVIENRPKIIFRFSDNFDKDESYFINKIINLNQDLYEIYKGSITKFKKTESFLKFYTHNNSIFKISKLREFELSEVTRKPLFITLNENLKEKSSFRIEINPKHSGPESSILEVGKYRLDSRIVKNCKPARIIKIRICGLNYFYKISTEINSEKNETIKITSTRVSDNKKEKIFKDKSLYSLKNAFGAAFKNLIYKTVFKNEEELTNLLQINENKDETNIRLIESNKINQMIDSLRTDFIASKKRKILELLLDNLVFNKLKFIDTKF